MISGDELTFRGLSEPFFNALKDGELKPILGFEKEHRDTFLIEIRNNYLDLYFLGHAVKVERVASGYNLHSADAFLPDKFTKWPISFKQVKESYKSGFGGFMIEVMSKIIIHKKGDISEGVSEMNHYISNRIAHKPEDIVVIDRQVTYEQARIDLLGLKKLNSSDFGFVVIELKNKENKDIAEVFSQTKGYLDTIREHYGYFQTTYNLILEQKIKLGLLDRRNNGKIADKIQGKGSIEGIVVLDNYNLRSSRLESAVKNDWAKVCGSHKIKLFLKTNTFDNRFMWDYQKACGFLTKCDL